MRTQVICEIGSNYESFQDVKDSIEFANKLGCVPKLQAFTHNEMNTANAELPREWMVKLRDTNVFYSVFGLDSLAFLESEVKPKMYKIASSKSIDKLLIKAVASTHKQTIISVGGCTLDEIRQCAKWFEEGADDMLWWTRLTLMHCVVSYPATCGYLGNLRDRINGSKLIPWGYSDHTTDLVAPVMAMTLGAVAIEKHFALRPMDRPDNPHSLYQPQFEEMVRMIELAEGHLKTHEQPLDEERVNLGRGIK